MKIHDRLGITRDADAATIKRAYAEKLRKTRPEDDPVGFQQLHEAYKMALRQCRDRDRTSPARRGKPAAPGQAAPQPPRSVPAAIDGPVDVVDPAALRDEIIRHACDENPGELNHWLDHCEALWSLHAKSEIGVEVMRKLYATAPPISGHNQDVLLHFFDLDHVLAGHDPLRLERLRKTMHLSWALLPGNQHDLSLALHQLDGYPDKRRAKLKFVNRCVSRLEQSFHRSRLIASALVQGRARCMRDFILAVSGNNPDCMPSGIDRDTMQFWLEAGNRHRVGKARLMVGAVRSVLLALLASVAFGLGQLFGLLGEASWSGIFYVTAGLLAGATLLWWAYIGYRLLDHWQTRQETESVRWPWFCLLFIPALTSLGLGMQWLTISDILDDAGIVGKIAIVIGVWALVMSLILSFRRFFKRWSRSGKGLLGSLPRVAWFGWIILLRLVAESFDAETGISLLAFIALLLWTLDLWTQRHKLRVRRRTLRVA